MLRASLAMEGHLIALFNVRTCLHDSFVVRVFQLINRKYEGSLLVEIPDHMATIRHRSRHLQPLCLLKQWAAALASRDIINDTDHNDHYFMNLVYFFPSIGSFDLLWRNSSRQGLLTPKDDNAETQYYTCNPIQ